MKSQRTEQEIFDAITENSERLKSLIDSYSNDEKATADIIIALRALYRELEERFCVFMADPDKPEPQPVPAGKIAYTAWHEKMRLRNVN